jgi:hypothetical protein
MNKTTAFKTAIENVCDQHGQSLAELSQQAPTLVIFLRHFG